MTYENNADYAMILLEDTGVKPQDRLNAVAKQVSAKLTKELNEKFEKAELSDTPIDPVVTIQGVEGLLNDEAKKLLGVDSLNNYLVSGRVDHDVLSMEYKVIMHIREKWVYKKDYDLGTLFHNDGAEFVRI